MKAMREQYRYLLFAVLSLFLVALGITMFVIAPEYGGGQQFLGFFVSGVSTIASVRNLLMTVKWFARAYRFEKFFGVNAPLVGWKNKDLLQQLVDNRLVDLAKRLDKLNKDENRVRERKVTTVRETQQALKDLETWSWSVNRAKKEFWTARNLAWEYHIGVFYSHQDYLNLPAENNEWTDLKRKTKPLY